MSHAPLIDAGEPGRYRRPLAATRSTRHGSPVPTEKCVLAALGPKMLQLAANRAAGAHPYLVAPDHTAQARETLGEGPMLLPEQTAILTTDADEAREIGTGWLRNYLAMPTTQTISFARGSHPTIWNR